MISRHSLDDFLAFKVHDNLPKPFFNFAGSQLGDEGVKAIARALCSQPYPEKMGFNFFFALF